MLNEWVFDARLMEQEVERSFILFHRYNSCRPIGRLTLKLRRLRLSYRSLVHIVGSHLLLVSSTSALLFVCSSAVLLLSSFVVHLSASVLLLVYSSLIYPERCLTSGSSANRYTSIRFGQVISSLRHCLPDL